MRVGSLPIAAAQYEAENAGRSTDTQVITQGDAQGGKKVGYINAATSYVTFTVTAPTTGTYTVNVRYDNGNGSTSTHNVSIDGGTPFAVSYPTTVDWGRFQWAQFTASLTAGTHTLKFTKGTGFAELDQIQLFK